MALTNPTGFDGVLQWTTNTNADPNLATTFASIDGARDVNVSINPDKTEVTDRSSRFKRYCPSMIDVEISATLTYNDDTKVFIEKCIAREVMTVAVLHTTGGEGLYITAQCFKSSFAAPLADGQTIEVMFAPVKDDVGGAPVWV